MSAKSNEQVIYGLNACLAAARHRPADLIRAYVTKRNLSRFSGALRLLAAKKRAYHIVTEEELRLLTSSEHHEGVSLLLQAPPPLSLGDLLEPSSDATLLVALVGVSNPHNIGAIARSAAHFGATGLILADAGEGALSAATFRVAQGALESLRITSIPSKELATLKTKGFRLIAPSPHKGKALRQFKFTKKSVLLLGEEGKGLAPAAERLCDSIVNIPGSGEIESLNVSAAAAVFLYQWSTQFGK